MDIEKNSHQCVNGRGAGLFNQDMLWISHPVAQAAGFVREQTEKEKKKYFKLPKAGKEGL